MKFTFILIPAAALQEARLFLTEIAPTELAAVFPIASVFFFPKTRSTFKYPMKDPILYSTYAPTYGDVEDSDEEANFVAGTDVTGLSEYEVKQLGSTVFITAKGWLIISMVIAGLLWFVSSFLG